MDSSWDETVKEVIHAFSKRAHCIQFKIGVAFFEDGRLLAAGYNGPPRKEPHCDEVGCAKVGPDGKRMPAGSGLCRGAHAEMNAIANAARKGINLSNSIVYCTFTPCYDCAKVLVNLGIKELIYEQEYPDEDPKVYNLFKKQGIKIRKFKKGR